MATERSRISTPKRSLGPSSKSELFRDGADHLSGRSSQATAHNDRNGTTERNYLSSREDKVGQGAARRRRRAMRIVDVESFVIGNPWKAWYIALVHTDEGITGIGEAEGWLWASAVQAFVEQNKQL